MIQSISLVVIFDRLDERPIQTERLSNMDNVKVLVNTGSDSYAFNLSRVPAIGEQIRIQDGIWTVRAVLHTPNADCAAEVKVSLSRPS